MATDDDMTMPFVLALIGGIFVLLASIGAIWLAYAASRIVSTFGALVGQASTVSTVSAIIYAGPIVGIILAIIIIVSSIMMRDPPKAKTFSIIVLVLGIISLVNFMALFGGIIGPILAIVGGALGISKAK